jgi:hypothetical protein
MPATDTRHYLPHPAEVKWTARAERYEMWAFRRPGQVWDELMWYHRVARLHPPPPPLIPLRPGVREETWLEVAVAAMFVALLVFGFLCLDKMLL